MRKIAFNKLILSFLLILSLPIVTGSVVYNRAIAITEENTINYNKAMLVQVQEIIDSQIQQTNMILKRAALNSQIARLATVRGEITPEIIYDMRLLMQHLASYKIINPAIVDFYLYFFNTGMIITSGAIYREDLFFEHMNNPNNISFEDWKDDLSSSQFFLSYGLPETGMPILIIPSLNLVEVRHTVPVLTSSLQRADAVMVILIDRARLLSVLDNISLSNSATAFIIDSDDVVIASTGTGDNAYVQHSMLLGRSGLMYANDNSGDVIIHQSSNILDWKFVTVIPRDVFMNQVNFIRILTLRILAICGAIGLLMIFFLSHVNYKPIKNLVSLFKEKRPEAFKRNETDFLLASIEQVLVQNEQLLQREADVEQVLGEQKKNSEKTFVVDCLNKLCNAGKHDVAGIVAALLPYGIDFTHGYFCMAVFKGSTDITVLHQVMSQHYIVRSDDDEIICLMQYKDGPIDHIYHAIKTAMSECELHLSRAKPATFIGISKPHENAELIPLSYLEAQKAVEAGMIYNTGMVYFADINKNSKGYYYPLELEMSIINNAKAGDYDKVRQILAVIYEKNDGKFNLLVEYVRCLVLDMAGTIIKIAGELDIDNTNIVEEMSVDYFTRPKTLDDHFRRMNEIYKDICLHVNKNKKSRNELLKDKLKVYIEVNCFNPNISVNYIADKFGITPTYLSNFFKEQTGQNMLDYINSLRISKGKEYLLSTDMTISKVAASLGYPNDIAFARAFKKSEGTTPSKYKEINQIKGTADG